MPISKAGTSGNGPFEGRVDVSSSMKAQANGSLRMLALTWGSLWATPSFLNGDIPLLSHFFALTKDHSFFGLLSYPETRSSTYCCRLSYYGTGSLSGASCFFVLMGVGLLSSASAIGFFLTSGESFNIPVDPWLVESG